MSAPTRPRILCLHGAYQTAEKFSQKIGGARRKLTRKYDLDFLDGPVVVPAYGDVDGNGDGGRSWWFLDPDTGENTLIPEALQYVMDYNSGTRYDAILAFSQGGTLAAALAAGGLAERRGVKAIVTAGAPYVPRVLEVAGGRNNRMRPIPMLHLSGENDILVPMKSTKALCDAWGGKLLIHEQGHLFPTRSAVIKTVMDFLEENLSQEMQ
mmetsp:Transcript_27312/g.54648  ORF Transcript_27312/g.54648 Transcript_27312/m.54648 type:complete len:210 (-) Transcript_27312:194-823(-)